MSDSCRSGSVDNGQLTVDNGCAVLCGVSAVESAADPVDNGQLTVDNEWAVLCGVSPVESAADPVVNQLTMDS